MRLAGRAGVVLHWLFGDASAEPLSILMYHRVAHHVPGLPPPLHNVTPRHFHKQISGLLDRGFQFWPLRKALEHHQEGQPIPARTVIVTFDDGFQTLFTEAFPVLRKFEVPATVFVNTAYLDSDGPFPFDAWGVAHCGRASADSYRPLTTEQCNEMLASKLIDIGAHTHTHHDHRGRPEAFRSDLQISVDIIRTKFGITDVPFAFPYGGPHTGFASEQLTAAARGTGVTCGLTTECVKVDPATDPFRWGRFNVFPWDSSATLAAKFGGWYSWAPKLNQRVGAIVKNQRKDRDWQVSPTHWPEERK